MFKGGQIVCDESGCGAPATHASVGATHVHDLCEAHALPDSEPLPPDAAARMQALEDTLAAERAKRRQKSRSADESTRRPQLGEPKTCGRRCAGELAFRHCYDVVIPQLRARAEAAERECARLRTALQAVVDADRAISAAPDCPRWEDDAEGYVAHHRESDRRYDALRDALHAAAEALGRADL